MGGNWLSGALLINAVVGIDAPEIVIGTVRDIFRSKQTHENAVILVVVLEGAIASDREKIRVVPFEVIDDWLKVLAVAFPVNRITAGKPDHVTAEDGCVFENSGQSQLALRQFNELRIRLRPNFVIVIAPILQRKDRGPGLVPAAIGPIAKVGDATEAQFRRLHVEPLIRKQRGVIDAEID